jgi:hypothetical protein
MLASPPPPRLRVRNEYVAQEQCHPSCDVLIAAATYRLSLRRISLRARKLLEGIGLICRTTIRPRVRRNANPCDISAPVATNRRFAGPLVPRRARLSRPRTCRRFTEGLPHRLPPKLNWQPVTGLHSTASMATSDNGWPRCARVSERTRHRTKTLGGSPDPAHRMTAVSQLHQNHVTALTQRGERRKATVVTHPVFGYKMSYGRMLEVQARMLAAHVRGDIPTYTGFTVR